MCVIFSRDYRKGIRKQTNKQTKKVIFNFCDNLRVTNSSTRAYSLLTIMPKVGNNHSQGGRKDGYNLYDDGVEG